MAVPGVSPGPTVTIAPGSVALTVLGGPASSSPEDVAQIWGPGYYDFFFQQEPIAGGTPAIRYAEFTVSKQAKIGVPLPLVIALHGGGGLACLMRHKTKLDVLADREGFNVMYLAGTGPQSQIKWELYFNPTVYPFVDAPLDAFDDVTYTRTCIGRFSQYVALDSDRIYACGFSNGGAMCNLLAARLAGGDGFKLAAVAAVSGHHSPEQFTTTGPISLMQIAGINDPVAPYEGGVGGAVGPIFASCTYPKMGTCVHGWKNNLGESARVRTHHVFGSTGNPAAQFHRYQTTNHEVVAVVGPWEHAWPGGGTISDEPGAGTASTDAFNATDEIWAFFKDKRLVV